MQSSSEKNQKKLLSGTWQASLQAMASSKFYYTLDPELYAELLPLDLCP